MNATRFALPPLPQPTYSFRDIPRASYPDLKNSTLEYVSDREDFQRCMAEMLLVCKEAVRRQREKSATNAPTEADGSKPLSLEYLADRLDVDEPLWGYVIRNEGRMQGFVCVTTFTNYEKSFRWDSINEAAFASDDEDMQVMRACGERQVDTAGELARKLQSTVRTGNVWQEGIVWPRIAEISLLGGLGCGRLLVELVLEDLEHMKAAAKANYDYVVLQATDNSISFYETLGFVRVGAMTERDDNGQQPQQPMESLGNSPKSNEGHAMALPDNITMSKVTQYEVAKAGEPLNAIAKRFKVDVHDIIFLNQINFSDLVPGSRLIKGTVLRIPDNQQDNLRSTRNNVTSATTGDKKWHIAKENDTPRSIARMYSLDCDALVQANRNRLKGLLSNSRLKQGTQVRISHLDAPDISYVPYAHWAFPDDDHFEEGQPSYMMAKSLKRKRGLACKSRPVHERLVVDVGTYKPTDLIVHIHPHAQQQGPNGAPLRSPSPTHKYATSSGYALFENEFRTRNSNLFKEKSPGQATGITNRAWQRLSLEEKVGFVKQSAHLRLEYKHSIYSTRQKTNSRSSSSSKKHQPKIDSQESLYNMVVRIESQVAQKVDVDTQEYLYWYVVTFIPDLRWCHLAPMVQDGTFGPEKPKVQGRPKWKLVNEDLGKELDISSSFCIPCKSRAMKRTLDADKEEWDILGDEEPVTLLRRSNSLNESSQRRVSLDSMISREDHRASSPHGSETNSSLSLATIPEGDSDDVLWTAEKMIKGAKKTVTESSSRKRKRFSSSTAMEGTTLVATLPDSGESVHVKLTGLSNEPATKAPTKRGKNAKKQATGGLGRGKGKSRSSKQVRRRVADQAKPLARRPPPPLPNALPPSSSSMEPPHPPSVDAPTSTTSNVPSFSARRGAGGSLQCEQQQQQATIVA